MGWDTVYSVFSNREYGWYDSQPHGYANDESVPLIVFQANHFVKQCLQITTKQHQREFFVERNGQPRN